MKSILLAALCLLCTLPGFARKFHFGIRACINFSDISLNKIKDDNYHFNETTSGNVGAAAGVFVEGRIIPHLWLQSELQYSQAGFQHDYSDFAPQEHYYVLNYLSVPLLVKGKLKGVGLYCGPQYSVLQSAAKDPDGFRYDVKADHQKIEWALVTGIEYTAPFGLGVSFRYQYGLTNMAVNGSNTYPIPDKITNRIFQFGLYYSFLR